MIDDPQEVTDRRSRFNLMGSVQSIANATELIALYDTELVPGFFDCVSDDHVPHGDGAMTGEERAAVKKLADAINQVLDEALLLKRERTGRKGLIGGWRFSAGGMSTVPNPEPEDLAERGWFAKVQPLAQEAFDTFSRRGWMSEGLWAS